MPKQGVILLFLSLLYLFVTCASFEIYQGAMDEKIAVTEATEVRTNFDDSNKRRQGRGRGRSTSGRGRGSKSSDQIRSVPFSTVPLSNGHNEIASQKVFICIFNHINTKVTVPFLFLKFEVYCGNNNHKF